MTNLIKKANSLINRLSDDPDDYPDMAAFRQVQDVIKELKEAITETKTPKVLAYVEGGLVQGARATDKEIALEVFDVDNLKADGLSRDEIEKEWKRISNGMKAIY